MSMPNVLQIVNVRKQYQSLRPLRLNDLRIDTGERVALSGLDAGAAEVLVNLVTGASLPDEGEVRVLGRATASIQNGDEWLSSLDRFGIVSPRAVLLDAATLLQNLAMPLTLAIDPMPAEIEQQARALGREAGLADEWLDRPVAALPAAIRARAPLVRWRSGRRCSCSNIPRPVWVRAKGSRLARPSRAWRWHERWRC
jgi:predicted ABC-type transport system involved in lysophospholipase L1 biosynthesis ATPase subunit